MSAPAPIMRIHKMGTNPGGKPKPFEVRWWYAGERCESFALEADAWKLRAALVEAVQDGETFDMKTGRPVSWAKRQVVTVAAWARQYLQAEVGQHLSELASRGYLGAHDLHRAIRLGPAGARVVPGAAHRGVRLAGRPRHRALARAGEVDDHVLAGAHHARQARVGRSEPARKRPGHVAHSTA